MARNTWTRSHSTADSLEACALSLGPRSTKRQRAKHRGCSEGVRECGILRAKRTARSPGCCSRAPPRPASDSASLHWSLFRPVQLQREEQEQSNTEFHHWVLLMRALNHASHCSYGSLPQLDSGAPPENLRSRFPSTPPVASSLSGSPSEDFSSPPSGPCPCPLLQSPFGSSLTCSASPHDELRGRNHMGL